MKDPVRVNENLLWSIKVSQTKAKCDLFGNNAIMITFEEEHPIPNRWIRFWTKVFFNSKWTLMEEES